MNKLTQLVILSVSLISPLLAHSQETFYYPSNLSKVQSVQILSANMQLFTSEDFICAGSTGRGLKTASSPANDPVFLINSGATNCETIFHGDEWVPTEIPVSFHPARGGHVLFGITIFYKALFTGDKHKDIKIPAWCKIESSWSDSFTQTATETLYHYRDLTLNCEVGNYSDSTSYGGNVKLVVREGV